MCRRVRNNSDELQYIKESRISNRRCDRTDEIKSLKKERLMCRKCHHYKVYITRHHIIPKADGGTFDEENLCYLCRNCHNYVEVFINMIKRCQSYYQYSGNLNHRGLKTFWTKVLNYFLDKIDIRRYSEPRQLKQDIKFDFNEIIAYPA